MEALRPTRECVSVFTKDSPLHVQLSKKPFSFPFSFLFVVVFLLESKNTNEFILSTAKLQKYGCRENKWQSKDKANGTRKPLSE